ncbi:MAG: hypothetical protein ACRCVK_19750 [Aeromonas veronii]
MAIYDEAWPLMHRHWQEIALFKDQGPLNPDTKLAAMLDHGGGLRTYTARQGGGLAGYAVFVLNRMAHYQHLLAADCDLFYLDPPYRRGANAMRFLRHCGSELAAEGVQRIRHRVKIHMDWSPLLLRLGYHETERLYEVTL